MSALVMGEYESDFPTHQPLSLPSTLIFCKSPSFFSSRTTFDPFSSELPLKNVAHPICDTCCIDSIKAQFLTFHPLLFLLIIVLFIPLKLWRHFSMLKAPQALQYACRTANTKFSRNSTFSRSNLPQRSYNTRQFNIPEHDDRWKVLNKPFKPTYQLESIQTKRPVALKVAYTGTGYFGSQKLPDGTPTIEGEVEKALYKAGMILESNFDNLSKIGWSRSSRTDKGVHSLATIFGARLEGMWTRKVLGNGQFEYTTEAECDALPSKINSYLPEDVRVLAAAPVPYSFDARKACRHRHYEYLIPATFLKDSIYYSDRESFSRMLSLFIGRHHWHNFGQIARKPTTRRAPKSQASEIDQQDESEFDDVEEASAAPHTDFFSRSTPEASPPSNAPHSETRSEPSLFELAPSSHRPSNARPSLYALDDYNAELSARNTPARTAFPTKQHPNTSYPVPDLPEQNIPKADRHVRLSKLSAHEVAQMPLDSHFAQDAFFRTITATSHDEVEVKGERYIRISIQGDSFLLHQIRRIIGALILAAKGIFSEEVLIAAIDSPFRILTPRAPPQGLLLRDALFLDLDFKGKDVAMSNDFARSHVYPHLHESWTSAINSSPPLISSYTDYVAEMEGSVLSGEEEADTKHLWSEINSMEPIREVRDIIPGYDDWREWHTQSLQERESKRTQRREHRETKKGYRRGNPIHSFTTRDSF